MNTGWKNPDRRTILPKLRHLCRLVEEGLLPDFLIGEEFAMLFQRVQASLGLGEQFDRSLGARLRNARRQVNGDCRSCQERVAAPQGECWCHDCMPKDDMGMPEPEYGGRADVPFTSLPFPVTEEPGPDEDGREP